MTFTQAAIGALVVWVIAVSLLLAFVRKDLEQDRASRARGLDDLDELRWSDWTPATGWPPVTCWHGCLVLHREDWWRAYVYRTCWSGCANLHREDWWRPYVDQPDQLTAGRPVIPAYSSFHTSDLAT